MLLSWPNLRHVSSCPAISSGPHRTRDICITWLPGRRSKCTFTPSLYKKATGRKRTPWYQVQRKRKNPKQAPTREHRQVIKNQAELAETQRKLSLADDHLIVDIQVTPQLFFWSAPPSTVSSGTLQTVQSTMYEVNRVAIPQHVDQRQVQPIP